MGDLVSKEEGKDFGEKLQFVQKLNDPYFGVIDIFRFTEAPYEYIMDYQKTFIEGDSRHQAYIESMKQLKEKDHKNLAKIHLSEVREEIHMCIKDRRIHTYCNYYNFTLEEAKRKKKERDACFSESELVYILVCLVDLGEYLKKDGVCIGEYRTDRIFLTPEGYVKMFLLEVKKDNKHTAYYQALADKSEMENVILSPEQLASIHKMEYEPGIDIFKADVFALGLIMLELMTLDKAKYYYTEDKSSYKTGKINFDLSFFSDQYSPEFISILRNCLNFNPNERADFHQIFLQLEAMRKKSEDVNYCIRLHDDDGSALKKKSQILLPQKGQLILSGIEKRLAPSPISTLTSSVTTGFQSKHSGQPLSTRVMGK